MKENNKTTCDPCEQDFKRKVNELVKEGHAPSHMERQKKEHEVKAAFGEHHAEANRPVGHTTRAEKTMHGKQPAMSGGTKIKK